MSAPGSPHPHIDFNSDALDVRLNLRFPADVNRVSQMVFAIMQVIGSMECAHGHEDDIDLSLTEALTNAIRHGAKGDPTKTVDVKVACDAAQGMLIVVSDPGDGFDPCCVPDPLMAENLYSNHGRGIFLMNRLMDAVEFHRGGTEIHMRKFGKCVNGSNGTNGSNGSCP